MTSIMDTWLLLRNLESNGERNRLLFVRKSRGSAHSNQVREFVLSDQGPELLDVYVGAAGVLTGSARMTQEAEDARAGAEVLQEVERRRRSLERRTAEVESQVASLRAQLTAEAAEVDQLQDAYTTRKADLVEEMSKMSRHRWADPARSPAEPEGTYHAVR